MAASFSAWLGTYDAVLMEDREDAPFCYRCLNGEVSNEAEKASTAALK